MILLEKRPFAFRPKRTVKFSIWLEKPEDDGMVKCKTCHGYFTLSEMKRVQKVLICKFCINGGKTNA